MDRSRDSDVGQTHRHPGRVVVTYARSWQALSAIRSLGRRGVEVIAADEYAVTPGGMSRYAVDQFSHPPPGADPEGFIRALQENVRRFRPRDGRPYVLMPIHRETYLIAAARAQFEPFIRVPLASCDQLELARHKRLLVEHAKARGIPVPRTWMPQDVEEARQLAPELSYPVFVKLPDAASGVGVQRVEDAGSLPEVFEALVQTYGLEGARLPLVQATAPGDDYCVTALFDRGRMGASLVYRNVLTFPRGHGPGAVRETVSAPPLETLTRRLLESLQWHGIAQVDWRWDGDPGHQPLLLEINPRFFGGLTQAIASGVDYPWLLFRLAVDGKIPPPEPVQLGTRTEAPLLSLLASIQEIADSDAYADELERAFAQARDELTAGHGWQALRTMLDGLRHGIDMEGRLQVAQQLLEENADNVSMLFDADDPLPVLGLVYPLAIFLRHGKLTQELLTGTQGRVEPGAGAQLHGGSDQGPK